MKRLPSKYWLYERSVQSPDAHAPWFRDMYRELRHGAEPYSFREDFCGTFALSCEWAKLGPEYSAFGVDLDPEPLAYGKRVHWQKLPPSVRRRVRVVRRNVLSAKLPSVDLVAACNFSFFIFKRRADLLKYFQAAYRATKKGGILILEMAGGAGMIEKVRETKAVYENGKRAFTYVWDQHSYDPIHAEGEYAIDFLFADGRRLEGAFEYDWRLWSIPEVRELVAEAGFSRSKVYWETSHKGEGTGEFTFTESGDNAHSWVSYVVGLKD